MFLRCRMCKDRWVSFRSWRKNICCERCNEDLQRILTPTDLGLVEAVRTMEVAIPAPSSIPSEFYGSPFNVAGYVPPEEPVRKPKPDDYASSESIRFASLPEPITITYDWSPGTGTITTDSSPTPDSGGSPDPGPSGDFSGGGGDFGGGGASGDW